MSTAVCPPRSAAGASAPAMTCERRLAARQAQPDASRMCADRDSVSLGPPLGRAAPLTAPLRGGRVMRMPGVHIESIHKPRPCTYAQIETACAVAQTLGRGRLVLV